MLLVDSWVLFLFLTAICQRCFYCRLGTSVSKIVRRHRHLGVFLSGFQSKTLMGNDLGRSGKWRSHSSCSNRRMPEEVFTIQIKTHKVWLIPKEMNKSKQINWVFENHQSNVSNPCQSNPKCVQHVAGRKKFSQHDLLSRRHASIPLHRDASQSAAGNGPGLCVMHLAVQRARIRLLLPRAQWVMHFLTNQKYWGSLHHKKKIPWILLWPRLQILCLQQLILYQMYIVWNFDSTFVPQNKIARSAWFDFFFPSFVGFSTLKLSTMWLRPHSDSTQAESMAPHHSEEPPPAEAPPRY